LLQRLYYDFFALACNDLLLFNTLFVFVYFFQRKPRAFWAFPDARSFYACSVLLLFLSANFMSISPTAYVPMCLDPRHYLFLIPVAAIPAAQQIADYLQEKQRVLPLLLLLAAAAVFMFSINGQIWSKPYFPCLLLMGVFFFLPTQRPWLCCLFALGLLGILLIGPIRQMQYAGQVRYNAQKEVLYTQLLNKNESCYIITDPVQQRLGRYYSSFKAKPYRFLSFDQFDFDTLDGRKKYVYLNWHTQYLSGLAASDLPRYAQMPALDSAQLVFREPNLNLAIYELSHSGLKPMIGPILLQSFNDFERAVPYWEQNPSNLTPMAQASGKRAYTYTEFSATFNYPLDSLPNTTRQGLLITAQVKLMVKSASSAKLVISMEDASGAYLWRAKDLGKSIKAFDNWWPQVYQLELTQAEIKPQSRLKIYVWNEDKKQAWVDDFEVRVQGLLDGQTGF
jgi:hypothetical protein